MIPNRKWTEEERRYLVENYGAIPLKKLAVHLQRTQSATKAQAYLMGLTAKKIHKKTIHPKQIILWDFKKKL